MNKVRIQVDPSLYLIPYLCALLAPNFLVYEIDPNPVSLVLIPLAFFWLIFTHIAFSWSRWVVVAMLPAFILLPFELYYLWSYKESPSIHIVAIALQTPFEQIQSFITPRVFVLGGGLALSLAIWFFALRYKPERVSEKMLRKILQKGALGIFLLSAFVVAGNIYLFYKETAIIVSANRLEIAGRLIQGVYPVGRLMTFGQYGAETRMRHAMMERRNNAKLMARSTALLSDQSKMAVVLVIGESANPSRWGLFGYERNTTPRLASRDGLIPVRDLISPWPATMMAVPVMISRKDGTDQRLFSDAPTLPRTLRQAGYQTYWISTQGTTSGSDASISDLASEAEFQYFLSGPTALRPGQPGDDSQLLGHLDAALKSDARKVFIVLHTQGSHFPYWERHPPEFEFFKPAMKNFYFNSWRNDESQRIEMGNSYDNSVLYTDYFLDQVINRLELSGRNARFVYAADHGESLPTADCNWQGHGFRAPSNFKVPGLIWLSKLAQELEPGLLEKLEASAKLKSSISDIFPTVLELAKVELANTDMSRSLLAPGFIERPRLVNTSKPIDFDRELIVTKCR
jgi:glucan phosphoethanolaminetransferase (alkaline phosphatase superfamily)